VTVSPITDDKSAFALSNRKRPAAPPPVSAHSHYHYPHHPPAARELDHYYTPRTPAAGAIAHHMNNHRNTNQHTSVSLDKSYAAAGSASPLRTSGDASVIIRSVGPQDHYSHQHHPHSRNYNQDRHSHPHEHEISLDALTPPRVKSPMRKGIQNRQECTTLEPYKIPPPSLATFEPPSIVSKIPASTSSITMAASTTPAHKKGGMLSSFATTPQSSHHNVTQDEPMPMSTSGVIHNMPSSSVSARIAAAATPGSAFDHASLLTGNFWDQGGLDGDETFTPFKGGRLSMTPAEFSPHQAEHDDEPDHAVDSFMSFFANAANSPKRRKLEGDVTKESETEVDSTDQRDDNELSKMGEKNICTTSIIHGEKPEAGANASRENSSGQALPKDNVIEIVSQ
jgi:hypothetical protein